jgi:ankyrin repeat protein
VEQLLDSGADIDLVDKGGYSAMMLAASNNFHQVVDLLIRRGADIDLVEHTHGWTALIWSAKRGHLETVRVLLEHGADRNSADDEGKTALDHATQKQYDTVIALLGQPES